MISRNKSEAFHKCRLFDFLDSGRLPNQALKQISSIIIINPSPFGVLFLRVRSDGPLRENKAEIVLKGAPKWTLARGWGRIRVLICSRVRPNGHLRENKAEIVLKGALRWTLARGWGRIRVQICSRVRPSGPLRENRAEIVLKGAPKWTLE